MSVVEFTLASSAFLFEKAALLTRQTVWDGDEHLYLMEWSGGDTDKIRSWLLFNGGKFCAWIVGWYKDVHWRWSCNASSFPLLANCLYCNFISRQTSSYRPIVHPQGYWTDQLLSVPELHSIRVLISKSYQLSNQHKNSTFPVKLSVRIANLLH